jgi:hypothetical protein
VLTASGREVDEDEQSEAFDDLVHPYVDPADLTRGTGNKYVGPHPREKVQLPREAWEWDRATRVIDGTEPMITQASAAALHVYQYKLYRARRELQKLQQKLDERKAAADASSERRANLSTHSRNSADNHRDHRGRSRSRMAGIPEDERENLVQNLDIYFMSIDTRGHIIPKTPKGRLHANTCILDGNQATSR